jgi:lipid-A-disaccharide synthase
VYEGAVPLTVVERRATECLALADAALVCSGTATLEAALVGCPMVIAYRGAGLTVLEYVLRKSIVPEHIGLPNLLLNRRLCPELIQKDCTPERLADEALAVLGPGFQREAQLDGFRELRSSLGEPGVISRWADFIVERWGGIQSDNIPQSGSGSEARPS